jgi:hypothetical protein
VPPYDAGTDGGNPDVSSDGGSDGNVPGQVVRTFRVGIARDLDILFRRRPASLQKDLELTETSPRLGATYSTPAASRALQELMVTIFVRAR